MHKMAGLFGFVSREARVLFFSRFLQVFYELIVFKALKKTKDFYIHAILFAGWALLGGIHENTVEEMVWRKKQKNFVRKLKKEGFNSQSGFLSWLRRPVKQMSQIQEIAGAVSYCFGYHTMLICLSREFERGLEIFLAGMFSMLFVLFAKIYMDKGWELQKKLRCLEKRKTRILKEVRSRIAVIKKSRLFEHYQQQLSMLCAKERGLRGASLQVVVVVSSFRWWVFLFFLLSKFLYFSDIFGLEMQRRCDVMFLFSRVFVFFQRFSCKIDNILLHLEKRKQRKEPPSSVLSNIRLEKGQIVFLKERPETMFLSRLLSSVMKEYRMTGVFFGIRGRLSSQPTVLSSEKSIRENVLMNEKYNEKRYKEICWASGLGQFLSENNIQDNEKYDPCRGVVLCKIIRIAACLYKEADVYLFFRPFDGMSRKTTSRIFERWTRGLRSGKCIVLCSERVLSRCFFDVFIEEINSDAKYERTLCKRKTNVCKKMISTFEGPVVQLFQKLSSYYVGKRRAQALKRYLRKNIKNFLWWVWGALVAVHCGMVFYARFCRTETPFLFTLVFLVLTLAYSRIQHMVIRRILLSLLELSPITPREFLDISDGAALHILGSDKRTVARFWNMKEMKRKLISSLFHIWAEVQMLCYFWLACDQLFALSLIVFSYVAAFVISESLRRHIEKAHSRAVFRRVEKITALEACLWQGEMQEERSFYRKAGELVSEVLKERWLLYKSILFIKIPLLLLFFVFFSFLNRLLCFLKGDAVFLFHYCYIAGYTANTTMYCQIKKIIDKKERMDIHEPKKKKENDISKERRKDPIRAITLENVVCLDGKKVIFHKLKMKICEKLTVVVFEKRAELRVFMDLLCRSIEPVRGDIFLDSVPLCKITSSVLRTEFGFIHEESFLITQTLRECLDPNGMFDEDILWGVLESVGLGEFLKSKKIGMQCVLSQKTYRLSLRVHILLQVAYFSLHMPSMLFLVDISRFLRSREGLWVKVVINRLFRSIFVIQLTSSNPDLGGWRYFHYIRNGILEEAGNICGLAADTDSALQKFLSLDRKGKVDFT
eukprot:GHVN01054667.1.p1 GENE.GHVN01054667.1~~GHVN01054667.1.p1  ORF type:complete len:1053 (+),score=74.77 GHVN01054667.1:2121-5279(+)